jgi:hypothetical protein
MINNTVCSVKKICSNTIDLMLSSTTSNQVTIAKRKRVFYATQSSDNHGRGQDLNTDKFLWLAVLLNWVITMVFVKT